jgi:Protein of unknown function (DUF1592)/Protein of unknown function (DUF1588)/Protein of unknown function (DUF1587)/Protein of unknown function (DUF1595)/Protein of unknown function (DUF1585)
MLPHKLKRVTGYVWGNAHVYSVSEYSVNWMKSSIRSLAITTLCAASAVGASNPILEKQFTQTVEPFVTKYCVGCHSGKTPAASLDLKSFNSLDAVVQDYPRWATVHDRLAAKEMPPKPMPAPPEADAQKVLAWITAVRADELKRHAGDPGDVPVRRLSNSEYNYTIRDLTGVDIRPTKEFPLDPANLAGFDNSGESLTMSSALLKKYLQAAHEVSDKMVLVPDGIEFAPHPMLSETDRDKFPIQRIINFYRSQPTDYADYFYAAWRYKYRAALGKPNATLTSTAAELKVSAKYLPMVWQLIEEPSAKASTEVGPIAKLQKMWRDLPSPKESQPEQLRAKLVEMREFVQKIRRDTAMQFATPRVKGLPTAAQPLQNWKLKQYAAHHRDSDPADLRNDTDPPPAEPVIPKRPGLHQDAAPYWAAVTAKARMTDEDLVVPAAERTRYEASFSRFASVFPDVFYVTERGRYWPDNSVDSGRLLSAGYHNVMGYYRDDTALMELILDDKGQKELNRLWDEFEFISNYTARTFIQFYLNQSGAVYGKGAESGQDLPAGHEVTEESIILGIENVWLGKAEANPANDPIATKAMRDHFEGINARLRNLEKVRLAAQPKQLDALLKFAAKAYRRPLTKTEQDDLLAYYHKMREKDGMSHEDAMRDSIVNILMSPHFLYRVDLLSELPRSTTLRNVSLPTGTVHPLSTYAIANRLSYFLWSSMPDEELLRHAASGDLRRPDVILAQTRRMLKDERVRDFATEFAGNWLDFRHFETFNSVDRDRFPSFTNDLREAMFQEPIHFIQDLFQSNGNVLDLIYGKYTFVNQVLAKHYGMPELKTALGDKADNDTWVKVNDADTYGRGGLLPMAVFLTNSSPGLRTSPVKRGFWVVHKLLGETIPPPPPVVPELPQDEAKSDLPLREVLAQHRANPVCAGCHARFDVFGLALEGYGPIGEVRTNDLAGRPVDTSATFPGGSQGKGLAGVEEFIRERREKDFIDGMARKLLAYALNRSLQLSDETLIDRMKEQLAAKGDHADAMIEAIVVSPQFLNKRTSVPAKPPVQTGPVAQLDRKTKATLQ